MPSGRRDRPARPPSSSRSRSPRLSCCRSGTWSSRSRCWSRARPMRRASTSRRESTAGWPSDRSTAATNVAAGQVLVTIDNPELLTRLKEAEAARAVALADLKRIEVGTRAEVVAARKAALASAEASARLAEQTYDRTKQLTARDFASVQKLDEATASLDVARRSPATGQARARRGDRRLYGRGARRRPGEPWSRPTPRSPPCRRRWRSSRSRRRRPRRSIRPAPISASSCRPACRSCRWSMLVRCLAALRPARGSGQGSQGRRSLRRCACRRSATGPITVDVRTIATRGEYAGWRATRATGDFDLRTFEIRAYPVDPVPGLRPGMSVYTDWKRRR